MTRAEVLWLVPVGALGLLFASLVVGAVAVVSAPVTPVPRVDQIGAVCQRLLAESGLHWSMILILGLGSGIVLVGVGVASIRAWARWRAQRCWLVLQLDSAARDAWLPPGASFDWLAEPPTLLDSSVPLAFTLGLMQPKIYISIGLIQRLTADELRAVVAHEEAHRRRRDPLRRLLLTLTADILFYVPAVARSCRRLIDEQEVVADAMVCARNSGARKHLAGALVKLLDTPAVPGVAMSRGEACVEGWERRVDALVRGHRRPLTIPVRDVLLSLCSLIIPIAVAAVLLHPVTNVHLMLACVSTPAL